MPEKLSYGSEAPSIASLAYFPPISFIQLLPGALTPQGLGPDSFVSWAFKD